MMLRTMQVVSLLGLAWTMSVLATRLPPAGSLAVLMGILVTWAMVVQK